MKKLGYLFAATTIICLTSISTTMAVDYDHHDIDNFATIDTTYWQDINLAGSYQINYNPGNVSLVSGQIRATNTNSSLPFREMAGLMTKQKITGDFRVQILIDQFFTSSEIVGEYGDTALTAVYNDANRYSIHWRKGENGSEVFLENYITGSTYVYGDGALVDVTPGGSKTLILEKTGNTVNAYVDKGNGEELVDSYSPIYGGGVYIGFYNFTFGDATHTTTSYLDNLDLQYSDPEDTAGGITGDTEDITEIVPILPVTAIENDLNRTDMIAIGVGLILSTPLAYKYSNKIYKYYFEENRKSSIIYLQRYNVRFRLAYNHLKFKIKLKLKLLKDNT